MAIKKWQPKPTKSEEQKLTITITDRTANRPETDEFELLSPINNQPANDNQQKKHVAKSIIKQSKPVSKGPVKGQLCTACGYAGSPKRFTRGSLLIEIVLWICFIIPGLIYSIWRLTTRYTGCPVCQATTMIPADSPFAQQTYQSQSGGKATLQQALKKSADETQNRRLGYTVMLLVLATLYFVLR